MILDGLVPLCLGFPDILYIWKVPCTGKNFVVWQIRNYIHMNLPWQIRVDMENYV